MAFGTATVLMPLPSPSQLLDRAKWHILVTCLQALHIEDNPSSGASDLTAVGIDNVFALAMAELAMPVSDVIVAYEREALSER